MEKIKKEKTQEVAGGSDEIKRHMSVLMEHADQQIKLIAEQYGSIKEDISQVKSKLDEHDGRFNRLEIAVMDNSRDIRRVEQKLDSVLNNHETRIHRLEEKTNV